MPASPSSPRPASPRPASPRPASPRPARPWWRTWAPALLLVVLVAAAAVLAARTPLPELGQDLAGPLVSGPWAPVLFGLVYAAATLAPLPKNLMSAAAGLVFGLPVGVAVVWSAAMAGAGASFWLARLLGREATTALARGHAERVDDLVRRHGLLAVLGLRLVPVVPFTALNYASGLTALRFVSYLVATAVGMLPGTVSFVALGAYGTDPVSAPFLAAAALLLALTAAAAYVAHRRRHRSRPAPTGGPAVDQAPPPPAQGTT